MSANAKKGSKTSRSRKQPVLSWNTQGVQSSLALLLVGVLAALAHGRILGNGFVDYDTLTYVLENPHVLQGLSLDGITWAFTTFHASNWHPLTWLSHMLDVSVYGLHPIGHHLSSLLLHVGNAMLLFTALWRMTGAVWRAAAVAALLAVHPMHVESVAWVAERKDVLALFFGLVAVIAYARYVEKPEPRRYLEVALFLALGLMAKPMLVTLPCVLLLLDYWPLGRVKGFGPPPARKGAKITVRPWWKLAVEKLPLMLLVAASSLLTSMAQRRGGAVMPVEVFDLWQRLANAMTSYVAYVGKFLAPWDLAVLYPLHATAWWAALLALAALAAFTFLVVRARRSMPWALVGWLWFLGTLVPVIGLVQVGSQSMADRYAYLPFIGLYVLVVWSAPALAAKLRLPEGLSQGRRVLPVAMVAWVAVLGCISVYQAGYWQDTISLFRHAEAVTGNNRLISGWLGDQYLENGEYEKAVEHFARAAAQDPTDVASLNKQGFALLSMGNYQEALDHFHAVLADHPNNAKAYNYMGVCAFALRNYQEALGYFEQALALDPYLAEARNNRHNLRLYMKELGLDPANNATLDQGLPPAED